MISYTSFSFFLLFFGITAVLYSIVPQKIRWIILLLGSYAFYFVSAKGHITAIILASLLVWGAGLWLDKANKAMKLKRKQAKDKEEKKAIKEKYNRYKRRILAVGVVSVVLILLICKYINFFIATINAVLPLSIGELSIIQPLGISFFILQGISYIADVYYGKIDAQKNPLRVSLYLSFMLTVVE
ncbi:MAG: hypothetical protein IJ731_01120 [Eubacterium sp.]|nr:hypothetical protein [Eubacterium sp.]